MRVDSPTLEELVRELPPDLRTEVRDFVEFLLTKHGRRIHVGLRQNWAGALREAGQQYSSIELQHNALEWRDG